MEKVSVVIRIEDTQTPGEYRLSVYADGERLLTVVPSEVVLQVQTERAAFKNMGTVQVVHPAGDEKAHIDAVTAIAKRADGCPCPDCTARRGMEN